MSPHPLLLGIDQGSSGSRALILDAEGHVRGYGHRPAPRLYPHPGWVEQDPDVVATSVATAITEAIGRAGCRPADLVGCGIASQRNTDFTWNGRTRRPVGHAFSWQDLRTIPLVEELAAWPQAAEWRRHLGYYPGPYMSAVHLAWRARHDPAFQAALLAPDTRIGLSAAWLLAALGEPSGHHMDYSLVQAMGLYDFRAECYWQDWLDVIGIPTQPLPQPVPTLHDYGVLRVAGPDGEQAAVPVLAMIGDQQGALFGYDCRAPGDTECTHGTASFVDVCAGSVAPAQANINVYFAWNLGQGHTYCLEADTTVTGAAIRWLKESAGLLASEKEIGALAATAPDAAGVVFVPAFTGLNVPYNDPAARASLLGLDLTHSRAHIARAFLEAIGYQVRAILATIDQEAGIHVTRLFLGGGVSASDLACQIQADLLGIPTVRPAITETTARAAALLAGLGAGVYRAVDDLPPLPAERTVFEPRLSADQRDAGYARWQRAVELVRKWGDGRRGTED